MSPSSEHGLGWWATKARQFRTHILARVGPAERAALTTWLTTPQAAAFDAMPVADRRHGLDVVAHLRAAGVTDPEVLLAGLLHDAGKGHGVRLWHRVAWSLDEAWGQWVERLVTHVPGFGPAFDRIRDHPALSARIAEQAGCPARTVDLIRHQAGPVDDVAGLQLRRADEAA